MKASENIVWAFCEDGRPLEVLLVDLIRKHLQQEK